VTSLYINRSYQRPANISRRASCNSQWKMAAVNGTTNSRHRYPELTASLRTLVSEHNQHKEQCICLPASTVPKVLLRTGFESRSENRRVSACYEFPIADSRSYIQGDLPNV